MRPDFLPLATCNFLAAHVAGGRESEFTCISLVRKCPNIHQSSGKDSFGVWVALVRMCPSSETLLVRWGPQVAIECRTESMHL